MYVYMYVFIDVSFVDLGHGAYSRVLRYMFANYNYVVVISRQA